MTGLRRQSFGRDDRGAIAVEFAILLPMIFVILGGLYEIGRAFQTMTAVNALASQYAISWADCQDNPVGTCNTEINLYKASAAIANTVPQLTSANVGLQMFQVSMTGTTPSTTYHYTSPTEATALSPAQIAAAQGSLQSGQSGVIVTVDYTYTVTMGGLGNILPASYPMSYTVVQLKN